MFGSSSLSPKTEDSVSEDEDFSVSTSNNADPKAKAELEPVVDEFGYISYGDPNGTQVTFDSEGNLMGCTDNAAGMWMCSCSSRLTA